MLFVQPHAPQYGLGLAPPEPSVAISGFFLAGHLPGNFGLGIPVRVRKPRLVEDFTVFLADWGEPIAIDGVAVGDGIFSEPYLVDGLGSAGMSSGAPRVLMPTASVPERLTEDPTDPVLELTDRMGDLDARGLQKPFRYLVRETAPDSIGMTTLLLSLHPDQTVQ